MAEAKIGVIGGSGLYSMEGLENVEEVALETPFGDPSDKYVVGTLAGKQVAFLARHGRGHRLLPSELNFRANLFGFKLLGVEHILSASAVGSLKEDVHPLDVVVPDQFIDRTRGRISTFFGNGIAVHVEFSILSAKYCRSSSWRRVVPLTPGCTPAGRTCAWKAAVLDARGVGALPLVGCVDHRNDQSSGSEARARSGDELRDLGSRDGL